jgi:hypothetical protein
LTSGPYFFSVSNSTTTGNQSATSANFGQQPFKYPAPAGYKSLCSTNLPTPAIADGSTAMDVKLYTGNNSTQSISGLKFSPDLAWFKGRSGTYWHAVVDSVRGRSSGLSTNSTNAEYTSSAANDLVSFDSTGFTLGPVSNWSSINRNGESLVAWTWDAGSSTVSNTDGTITSQVRANPSAGVSVATWTSASSSTTNSFGHGLAKTPEFIVMKSRNNAGNNSNWWVYHSAIGATKRLYLNTTDAATTTNVWVSGPSSSVVNIKSGAWQPGDWITYAFAPVEGFSAFGSYTGNGSNDGPFVYTGFRPRYLLIKGTSLSHNWYVFDSSRDSYNGVQAFLNPPGSNAESTAAGVLYDFTSNGFKLRSGNGELNGNSYNYIYAAFAEHPFKTSRAR